MSVDVVAVLMIVISIGFVAQPALDAHAFGRGVVESGIKQLVGLEIAVQGAEHRRRRIEPGEPRIERFDPLVVGEIAFGHHDPVGHRRLLDGFFVIVELTQAVNRIDRGDDAVEREPFRQNRIADQGVDDGGGVGEPDGFDQHPGEFRDLALGALNREFP